MTTKPIKNRPFQPDGTSWFTSDTHFGHPLMISRYPDGTPRHRDFRTIEEHDDALIQNWNQRVGRRDHVFHLGDFALKCDPDRMLRIFRALKGRIHLTIGNHDWPNPEILALPWASEPEHRRFVIVESQHLVLDHYSGRTWAGSFNKALQLFGHSHGKMPSTSKSCDVGVDAWSFKPVCLDEIKAHLALQPPFVNLDSGEETEPEPATGMKP